MATLQVGFSMGQSKRVSAADFSPAKRILGHTSLDYIHEDKDTSIHGDADDLLEIAFRMHDTLLHANAAPVEMRFSLNDDSGRLQVVGRVRSPEPSVG
jgi:hypothetical protein